MGVTSKERDALAIIGKAFSDPVRIEMLGMMAEGRTCCGLPGLVVPASASDMEDPGICVCEFVEHFEMGQSRVSYHLGKLKEAGLVKEERRGKWSFYSLDREAAWQALALLAGHLKVSEERMVSSAR